MAGGGVSRCLSADFGGKVDCGSVSFGKTLNIDPLIYGSFNNKIKSSNEKGQGERGGCSGC